MEFYVGRLEQKVVDGIKDERTLIHASGFHYVARLETQRYTPSANVITSLVLYSCCGRWYILTTVTKLHHRLSSEYKEYSLLEEIDFESLKPGGKFEVLGRQAGEFLKEAEPLSQEVEGEVVRALQASRGWRAVMPYEPW
jgi:hypothetical protein